MLRQDGYVLRRHRKRSDAFSEEGTLNSHSRRIIIVHRQSTSLVVSAIDAGQKPEESGNPCGVAATEKPGNAAKLIPP